jgi:hypothetical protein
VTAPAPGISLPEVYARTDTARHIVAGAASALPAARDLWSQVDRALSDVPALGAVIERLTAELAETRMDRANLLAAMQATLAAHADGETDPLFYLRDELNARQTRWRATGRRSEQLPADAPARPAGTARWHATDGGHQPR